MRSGQNQDLDKTEMLTRLEDPEDGVTGREGEWGREEGSLHQQVGGPGAQLGHGRLPGTGGKYTGSI